MIQIFLKKFVLRKYLISRERKKSRWYLPNVSLGSAPFSAKIEETKMKNIYSPKVSYLIGKLPWEVRKLKSISIWGMEYKFHVLNFFGILYVTIYRKAPSVKLNLVEDMRRKIFLFVLDFP